MGNVPKSAKRSSLSTSVRHGTAGEDWRLKHVQAALFRDSDAATGFSVEFHLVEVAIDALS